MKRTLSLLFLSCVLTSLIQATNPPAFPTAEGFGKWATGGRGGRVVEVTNTDDDANGTTVGSFRWALKQYTSEPTTIVFRVSGIIKLVADIRATRTAGTTIAGQTAPGDGICIRGHKVNLGGCKNLIIRHLRFRIGLADDNSFVAGGALGIENASNWIIDHCTFGWSGEENTTIYDNTLTTVQWCILHEGLYACGHSKGARSYGCQWGGQSATYHHNLLAHNKTRSPRFNGARSNDINVVIDFVNNVNYNWGGSGSCYGGDMVEGLTHKCNMVNNYYKPGPAYPGTNSSYFVSPSFNSNQTTSQVAVWYLSGNYMEGTANTSKITDNTLGVDGSAYVAKGIAKTSIISTTAFTVSDPVTTETAQNAYNSVVAKAGAFPRDTVDRRIVYEVKTGTATGQGTTPKYIKTGATDSSDNEYYHVVKGIIDNPVLAFVDTVAYPRYKTYNTVTDNDHDGIDDAWELKYKLDPTNADDGNIITQSGYTFLEIYLNSLVGESIDTTRIVKQAQTIAIDPFGTKAYGDASITLNSTVSPSSYTVVYSVVSGPATISGNKITLTGIGEVVVMASQAGDVYFYPASSTMSFIATKGIPVITWNNPNSIVYGTSISSTQLNATVTGTTELPTYSVSAGDLMTAGTHTLTVSYKSTDYYESASKTVILLVQKAPSIISWNTPETIAWTTALSATQLNAAITGTSSTPVYSPAFGEKLSIGTHLLTVTYNSDANYEGTSKTVSIVIKKAPTVITWADPQAIVRGTALSSTQLNANINGSTATAVYSPSIGTILQAGTQTLSVSVDSDDNYEAASQTVSLTIKKKASVITWNNPASIMVGTALSSAQLNATVTGTSAKAVYSPKLGTVLTAGQQTLTVTFDSDANCEGASKSVSLEVTQSSATKNLSNSNINIFPNPTSDIVKVVIPEFSKIGRITVLSSNGIVVLTKIIEATETEINLAKFSSGVYFLRIETPEYTVTKQVTKK